MANDPRTEFGDFQTPPALAQEIVGFLRANGEDPRVVVEPTCGRGSFLLASLDSFPHSRLYHGLDINQAYVDELRHSIAPDRVALCRIECRDFFDVDWPDFMARLGANVLIVGNPPWVTNSVVGALNGGNLPLKTNFQKHGGFAAKTGKANFDISEWMLIRLLESMGRRKGCLAMLCKTFVARKVLRHAWLNGIAVDRCSIHLIDAGRHFHAAVDACLLIVHTGTGHSSFTAQVYPGLSCEQELSTVGLVGGELVPDVGEYRRLCDLEGTSYYTWRSGVKHDAAAVMEFARQGPYLVNGLQEECELEPTFLFPLLKSSDVANGRLDTHRVVLLTQKTPSDGTEVIQRLAPRTWEYLMRHADRLDKRRSMIYAKRPRFSVFGVGDYTFAPWKVAVSGLYKTCRFEVVGSLRRKPIVVDDTCYFIPCRTESEAVFACELLNSDPCQRFLKALVFADAKRPVTIDVLKRIDLKRVADHLHRGKEAEKYFAGAASFENKQGLLVFEHPKGYGAVKRQSSRKRS